MGMTKLFYTIIVLRRATALDGTTQLLRSRVPFDLRPENCSYRPGTYSTFASFYETYRNQCRERLTFFLAEQNEKTPCNS